MNKPTFKFKVTMNKETIEKAAQAWAQGEITKSRIERAERAFKQGAYWRIDSVWHKKCDIPQPFRPCLVELRGGFEGEEKRYVAARRSEYEWIELTHYEHSLVHRWAYVSDLLPGAGKEADR